MEVRKPLWTCPRCGRKFVTSNPWHSCNRFRLSDHFKGKEPQVRRIFNRLRELARKCGPTTVYAQKTRIVFMVRVRFAGAVTHKDWLQAGLWRARRAENPALLRIEAYGPDSFGHYFRFSEPSQLDREFAALVREAYVTGPHEHLK